MGKRESEPNSQTKIDLKRFLRERGKQGTFCCTSRGKGKDMLDRHAVSELKRM